MYMQLSIVIVNYNVKHYLRQCLDSVRKAIEGMDAEVFVVDNHSRDGSVEYLKQRYQDVKFIESNHNLGFARANNLAIRQSRGKYVLLLNPDTIVAEDTIRNVISFMDAHEEAGGVGVRMLKCNGESALESRRGMPTPMTAFYKMCGLCRRFPKSRRFGKYYMGYLPWDKPCQIDIISGAFCMLRHTALDKVGLIDEDFFMYGEDIDLSYRLLKGGFQNWYLPETILHYKGESTQKSSFRYVHVFYEAMLIFFKKHYGNVSAFISLPIKIAIYVKAAMTLATMQFYRMQKALGFFSTKRTKEAEYIFIGSEETISACRQLAERKGLTARYEAGDDTTKPNGHLDIIDTVETDRKTFMVYDVSAYTYKHILQLFAKKPMDNVRIATYDKNTHTLITEDDIIM